MKVLIVCIQGLTSGILAQRLTCYAEKEGQGYCFRAASYYDIENILAEHWADIVLLTPQVKNELPRIQALFKEQNVSVWVMGETSVGLRDVALDYADIVALIQDKMPQKRSPKAFAGQAVLAILEASVFALFIWAVGQLFFVAFRVWGQTFFYDLYRHTACLVCLYAGIYLGYRGAVLLRASRRAYMLYSLMAMLLFSSYKTESFYSGLEQISNDGILLQINDLGIRSLPWYLFAVCLSLAVYAGSEQVVKQIYAKRNRVFSKNNHYQVGIVGTGATVCLMFLRIVLENIIQLAI